MAAHPGSSRRARMAAETLLTAALVVAPLAFGSVRIWSIAMVVALSVAAAMTAAAARPRRWSAAAVAAFAVAGWVGLQAVPLPPSLLRIVSPRAIEILELASPTRSLERWHALALDPAATLREFARLFGLACALFAASRISSHDAARRRLVRAAALVTLAECSIIVVQALLGVRRIYGLVEVRTPTLLGTFGNVNHQTGFLTLGAAALAAMALAADSASLRRAYGAGAALAGMLIVGTLSRSGLAGLFVSMVILVALTRHRLGLSARRLALMAAVGAVALLAALAIALRLQPLRAARVAALLHLDTFLREEKVTVWRDLPPLLADYARAGIGRGAFEQVFPAYRVHADAMTFSHVESAPLQALVDLGWLAGCAVVLAWGYGLVRGLRQARPDPVRAAALAGLAGITVHDLGDFSLDASAAVGLYAALAWGVLFPAGATSARRRLLQMLPLGLGGALAAAGLLIAGRQDLTRDLEAIAETESAGRDVIPLLAGASARHPAEPWFPFRSGVEHLRRGQLAEAMRALNRALALEPTSWRAHLAVGEVLLRAGRAKQGLLELRLAYRTSNYSPEPLVVLTRLPAKDTLIEAFVGDDPDVLRHAAAWFEGIHDTRAEALCRRLATFDPEGHRLLARILAQSGRFDEALKEARLLAPGDVEGLLLQVRALDGLRREDESDALLAGVPGLASEPRIACAMAERANTRGDADAALRILSAVPHALPPDQMARTYRIRAAALEKKGRVREAISDLVSAARIEPTEDNRLALGAAYERAGLLRQAFFTYRNAVRSSAQPSLEVRQRLSAIGSRLNAQAVVGGSEWSAGAGAAAAGDEDQEEPEAQGGEGDEVGPLLNEAAGPLPSEE